MACKEFAGIAELDVKWLVGQCRTCISKRQRKNKTTLTPITTRTRLERIQIDLIDFHSHPDEDYHYILHIRDHFVKLSVLRALRHKTAEEVAHHMRNFIADFGIPRIVQSDNGGEFKGALHILLREHGIAIIKGRPRTPRTQGLVEQANRTVKQKLRDFCHEHRDNSWSKYLMDVQLAMNTSPTTGLPTNMTPYDVTFRQPARWITRISRTERGTREIEEEDTAEINNSVAAEDVASDDPFTENDLPLNSLPTPNTHVDPSLNDPFLDDATIASQPVVSAVIHETDDNVIDPQLLNLWDDVERRIYAHQEKVRGRMIRKYGRNNEVFEVDDVVTLYVPEKSRSNFSLPSIPAVILDTPYENRHQLVTAYGILKNLYPESELRLVQGTLASILRREILGTARNTRNEISLAAASWQFNQLATSDARTIVEADVVERESDNEDGIQAAEQLLTEAQENAITQAAFTDRVAALRPAATIASGSRASSRKASSRQKVSIQEVSTNQRSADCGLSSRGLSSRGLNSRGSRSGGSSGRGSSGRGSSSGGLNHQTSSSQKPSNLQLSRGGSSSQGGSSRGSNSRSLSSRSLSSRAPSTSTTMVGQAVEDDEENEEETARQVQQFYKKRQAPAIISPERQRPQQRTRNDSSNTEQTRSPERTSIDQRWTWEPVPEFDPKANFIAEVLPTRTRSGHQ